MGIDFRWALKFCANLHPSNYSLLNLYKNKIGLIENNLGLQLQGTNWLVWLFANENLHHLRLVMTIIVHWVNTQDTSSVHSVRVWPIKNLLMIHVASANNYIRLWDGPVNTRVLLCSPNSAVTHIYPSIFRGFLRKCVKNEAPTEKAGPHRASEWQNNCR